MATHEIGDQYGVFVEDNALAFTCTSRGTISLQFSVSVSSRSLIETTELRPGNALCLQCLYFAREHILHYLLIRKTGN